MNVPAGYSELDLVGFTDRGIYNALTDYVQNDLTHFGGNIWLCKVDDTIGITPAEGPNWTLWIGEPTNLTEAIIAPLEVSPATAAHSAGDQLIFNDVLYKVISAISIGDSLTVGTNIEVARKIVYQISGIESDIATIEPTATASKNYAVGEYMFYGWEFYRVTTAITAGDTIVTTGAGQNVTEVTVGGELTTANSKIKNKTENTVISTQAVETLGSEALSAHSKLDLFLASNGNMYEATNDISAGDTITSGVNCEQTSVIESLKNKAGLFSTTIRPNSSSVFNLDNFIGIVVTTHNSNTNLGYVAVVRAAGFLKEIVSATGISASISNSVLTITNSTTATANASFIVLSGEISVATT